MFDFREPTIDDIFGYTRVEDIKKENTSLKRLNTSITEELKRQGKFLSDKEKASLEKAAGVIDALILKREVALKKKISDEKAIEINSEKLKSTISKRHGRLSDMVMLKYIVAKSARASLWNKSEIADDFHSTLKQIVKWKMGEEKRFNPNAIIDELEKLFEDTTNPAHATFTESVKKLAEKLGVQ